MTQKKFAECKQQIKTLKGKVNLRFNKNKDSDKTILKDFENVCKKLETTAFKNFKTIANMELKEFLEKQKNEQLKSKK